MGHSVSSGLVAARAPSLIWLILLYLTYFHRNSMDLRFGVKVVHYNQTSQFGVGARTNFGEIRPDDTEGPKFEN